MKKYKCIHVAGTNGKGSTANYIANILMAEGKRVGLFTSPHLLTWQERIKLNGNNIDLPDAFEEKLYKNGYFINTTKIAIQHFAENDIDYAVIEAGIGGRHDITMTFDADISVITTVAKDHMEILGKRLSDIAYQKAGIIRDQKRTYSFFQKPIVKHVLNEQAYEKRTEVSYLKIKYVKNIKRYDKSQTFDFSYRKKQFKKVKIRNISKIQVYNAALACMVCLDEGVSEDAIRAGLEKKIPCRTEIFDNEIILDVAHNYNSFLKLNDVLVERFPHNKFNYMIAMQDKKDAKKIAKLVNKTANRVFLVDMKMDNFYEPKDISHLFKNPHYLSGANAHFEKSYENAYDKSKEDGLILVVAGSFYLTGKVYSLINSE